MLPLLLSAISVNAALDNNPKITGNCHPARVHFTGRITASGPGPVRYAWARSDQPSTRTFVLNFDKPATLPVTYDWILTGPADGWVVLQIIAPDRAHSDKIHFHLTCPK